VVVIVMSDGSTRADICVIVCGIALDLLSVSVCRHRKHRNFFCVFCGSSQLHKDRNMVVKISPSDKGSPNGKLAEAELHFIDGALQGMKLVGFAIWERRTGGGRNVTFPARSYTVNGDKRSFALLRPTGGDSLAQDRVRELILQAYSEHEAQLAVAS